MALVKGMARDTPVGPPWMTMSRGYLRAGSKSAGLCRTPSIVAPSWLVHETTSRVLVTKPAVCAFMSVSFLGFASVAAATNTSGTERASDPRNATLEPSRESVKLDPTHASAGARRVTVLLEGSRRNKYEKVRCDAEKKSPLGLQATIDGSSSNDGVRTAGVPPAAGTVA